MLLHTFLNLVMPLSRNSSLTSTKFKCQRSQGLIFYFRPLYLVSGQTSSRELTQDRGMVQHGPMGSQNSFLQPSFTTVLPSNVFVPAGTAFLQGTTTSGPTGQFPSASNAANLFSGGALSIPTIITTAHVEQRQQGKKFVENGMLIVVDFPSGFRNRENRQPPSQR